MRRGELQEFSAKPLVINLTDAEVSEATCLHYSLSTHITAAGRVCVCVCAHQTNEDTLLGPHNLSDMPEGSG